MRNQFKVSAACLCAVLCALAATAQNAAPAAQRAATAAAPATAAAVPDSAALAQADSVAAAEFMVRFGPDGKPLIALIQSDYQKCVGDPARVSRDLLIRWKTGIDSLVMHPSYSERFKAYVAATGVKAHDVRPCEPIVFAERREREQRELDSTISAQRVARERAQSDSVTLIRELASLKPNPADILNIPAGISRTSLQAILARNNVRTKSMPDYLQAERIKFGDLIVTIAFYFDKNNRYAGYEIETDALKAEQLDKTVRQWADRLITQYQEKLGPPNLVTRVSFRDIKQGRMSIIANWEKGPSRPKVLVGLATHDHLYYAKVMVSY